jgi:hypothetical protein
MAEAKPEIRFSEIHNLHDQSYQVTIFLDNINNDEYRFFITADESDEQESLNKEMRTKNKLPQMSGKNIFLFPKFVIPPGTGTYMFYLFSGPKLQDKTFDELIEHCDTNRNECKIVTKTINVMPPPMQGGRRHRKSSRCVSKRCVSKRCRGSKRCRRSNRCGSKRHH